MIEAFAVEVGGTRVAVHGTAFSVQIVDGQVVVDVEHGAVAVGPVGNAGTTTGHLLVGPSRGVFSLDGGRTARLLDRPAMETPAVAAASQAPDQVADRVVVAAAPADADRAAEAPASDAVAAAKREIARAHGGDHADHADHVDRVDHVGGGAGGAKPAGDAKPAVDAPAEPPRLTTATVRARIDRCFRSAFNADPSSTLKAVSSTLSIDVNADGTVRAAKVDPPLTAELTGCVGSALSGRFADDAGHVDIPLSFQR
jgi:hypothetical protein